MSLQTTTWQTVGPFFRIGLERLFQDNMAGELVKGDRIAIEGKLVDGNGAPIPDALIEVWQANAAGKYAHPADMQEKPVDDGFRGFGRIPTDDYGAFRFTTIKPGSVAGPADTMQAPHLVIGILMRGLLKGLVTRAYFPGEPLNISDPILELVPEARRKTLMLQPSEEHSGLYFWDIRMQGEDETVFLDF